MSRIKCAVRYVGYTADVIVRKYAREVQYAKLDFVSGCILVCADDGAFVVVPNRADAEPFLKRLSEFATELQNRVCQHDAELIQQASGLSERTVDAGDMIFVPFELTLVAVHPGTRIKEFIRQITQRFTEIKLVLKQAEEIGLGIKRRPYSEYIEEIDKTGICRVEYHGDAYFVDGRLTFYPDHKVAFVRPEGQSGFEVLSVESGTGIESQHPN